MSQSMGAANEFQTHFAKSPNKNCMSKFRSDPAFSIQLLTVRLLTIQYRLRCRFAHFKLCAHFLQARGKRFDLFFLFRQLGLKALLLLCNR